MLSPLFFSLVLQKFLKLFLQIPYMLGKLGGFEFVMVTPVIKCTSCRLGGMTDLVKTQGDWEKAMLQAETMDERMDMFLDSIEDMAAEGADLKADSEVITDEEVDRMIEAEAEAEHRKELDKIAGLRAELDALKQRGEKQK